MKRNVFTNVVFILFLGLITITFENCTKEGPTGPAGPAGSDGADANAVTAADQAAYDAADGTIGARLYDHVLNETDLHTDTSLSNHANFFRCKCCHGWDLLGQKGVLIGKTPSSSYPVAADVDLYTWSKTHSIREIFDAIKNTGGRMKSMNTSYNGIMPDYGNIGLTDAQIWDLVKWLKEDAHNIFDFADLHTEGAYPTGTFSFTDIGKGGDPVAGKTTYDATCKGCHGADGTQINVYCKPQGEYIGGMCRGDVHEIQHKVKWGMPFDYDHYPSCPTAGEMAASIFANITDQDIRNILVMGQDTVAFPGD